MIASGDFVKSLVTTTTAAGLVVILVALWSGQVRALQDFCPHAYGFSMGSQHFCGHERCSHTRYPHGLGLFNEMTFWNSPSGALGPPPPRQLRPGIPLINVTVTQISVNDVVLKGWFHIRLDIPPDLPLYLLYLSVVTDEQKFFLPTGEFTTDLINRCDGVSLNMTPTQSELLPCGSTFWTSIIHPNSVLFSREALVEGTQPWNPPPIPRKPHVARNITNIPEFHMNWRMTPGSACVNMKIVWVRVEALTYPAHLHHPVDFRNCNPPAPVPFTGQICEQLNPYNLSNSGVGPLQSATKVTKIHFPPPSLSQGFYGPDPSPPFVDANAQVNCRVPLATVDRTTVPPPLPTEPPPAPPYVEVLANLCNGSICNPDYNVNRTFVICNLPLFQRPEVPTRTALPLYQGRCHIRVRVSPTQTMHSGNLSVNHVLQCEPPDAEDQPFNDALPTMQEYIENFRQDVCNCFPDNPRVDNGSLNFQPPDGTPHRTTPAPDYPDADSGNRLSPGRLRVGLSANQTKEPGDTILTVVKRARMLHGTLYAIAFLFVIPVAIFMARYMKEAAFFGVKLMIYDLWYSVHAFGTMFVFVLMQPAQMIIYVEHVWTRNADPVEKTWEEKLHVQIGWVVVILYAILSVTGGLRCYDQNSIVRLTASIWFHGILGYIFYYLGLAAMIVVLMKSPSQIAQPATMSVLVWIAIDVVFHLTMTCFTKLMDRRNFPAMKRRTVPVMANLIRTRNAPGRGFRLVMFGLYLVLSIGVTGLFVFLTLSSEGFNTADRTTYTFKGRAAQAGTDRQNRH